MKIVFTQLPLNDHNLDYISANIPCGAETISGYIKSRNAAIETAMPPFEIISFASNRVIADRILKESPEILAFTCYAWNIERSLAVASLVKSGAPGINIILGGPEISAGSYCFSREFTQADLFVSGEGEWFFNRLMKDEISALKKTGGKNILQPGNELIPAGDIYDPFQNSTPSIMPDGSIFLELTRGCPYRCSYCHYSKNCLIVRELPFERLTRALKAAPSAGIKEIYILSPNFNLSTHFTKRLKEIISLNKGVKLHTEMRTEKIDRKTALLIKEAGFTSLEVGIQTLTPAALKEAGRGSDPEKEISGILNLKEAGIELKIGMIPGLPGDDPESFIKGAERLKSLGLGDSLEIYTLMVLPGTRLREQIDLLSGYSYQPMPPYFFLEGGNFSFNDQLAVHKRLEEISGYSKVYTRAPDLVLSDSGVLIRSVDFDGDRAGNWNPLLYSDYVETNPFTFKITFSSPENIYKGLPGLLDYFLDDGLFNIIFISDLILDEKIIIEYMTNRGDNHYLQRLSAFDEWRDGLQARFYQIFRDRKNHGLAFENYTLIEPVYRLEPGGSPPLGFTAGKTMLLAGRGAFKQFRRFLETEYIETPEIVSFEDETDMEEFYKMADIEYVRYPFKFRTITLN